MGVDVNLYAEGDVSDEQLAAAEEYMVQRVGGLRWDDKNDAPLLVRDKYSDTPRVEVSTYSRFYGPGYERGNWPQIHAAIVALRAALPHCTVYYGGDTTDDGIEATDEYLAEIWAHWLGPEGDAYHDRSVARQAALIDGDPHA